MHNSIFNNILCILILFAINSIILVSSDYENTWNFYYEQPCCGNTNGQHHLRHHRGENETAYLFIYLTTSISLAHLCIIYELVYPEYLLFYCS